MRQEEVWGESGRGGGDSGGHWFNNVATAVYAGFAEHRGVQDQTSRTRQGPFTGSSLSPD